MFIPDGEINREGRVCRCRVRSHDLFAGIVEAIMVGIVLRAIGQSVKISHFPFVIESIMVQVCNGDTTDNQAHTLDVARASIIFVADFNYPGPGAALEEMLS